MVQLRFLLLVFCFSISLQTAAQTARQTGLRENTPAVFALTNGKLVIEPGNTIVGGTIVVRDGIIEAAGRDVTIPPDAYQVDITGRIVYPGFIDLMTHYGMPGPDKDDHHYWNPQVRSHYSSAEHFRTDREEAAALRSMGFVVAQVFQAHGIFRGKGSIVALGEGDAARQLIRPDISHQISFRPSDDLGSSYPSSAMGSVALIRQTLLDAAWYIDAHEHFGKNRGIPRPETSKALNSIAMARKQNLPFVFDVENEHWFLKAYEIADSFSLNAVVLGSGHEYRRLDAIVHTRLPVILPLNFPDPPSVMSPEQEMDVSLEDLRHWYLAPANPSKLSEANIQTAYTSHGSGQRFLGNLQTAVERGLDKDVALASLTTIPAKLAGIDHLYGTLETGKSASFIVSGADLFDEPTAIEAVWVDGIQYRVREVREKVQGEWRLASAGRLEGATITIEGDDNRLRGSIRHDDNATRLTWLRFDNERLTFGFPGDSVGLEGICNMSATVRHNKMLGIGTTGYTGTFSWMASRKEGAGNANNDRKKSSREILDLPVRHPGLAYGIPGKPVQPGHVVIRNATIWTQGPGGIMNNADLLVSAGKIVTVGHQLEVPRGTKEVDAGGRHVTPGLIDPHLHTSIAGGVNEFSDAITSETRIKDVIDADNVWIYRLLAGGITSATLYHGSANPIGGQNAVVKMRWGQLPADMLIEDAAPGLKLALGENVKRLSSRYPNTRQGTEQLIRDALKAAVEYRLAWQRWEDNQHGLPPRRDLQLEAIAEVIEGHRKAHVHAYRQDEMLMMMRLAEEFGFTVGSFEHTLEGYKIADELKEHGAAAVVWSDWSSFKVEAYDGILYNARLLNEVGVLTALHSDNTQLSTRMNWEAAKTVMTGVSESDAMNFITLHPAKIMGIDHRVGSLEPGKDADFVIWNGHPLSSFSIPDQTWLEGRKYFDREADKLLREEVNSERAMIINAIIRKTHQSTVNKK